MSRGLGSLFGGIPVLGGAIKGLAEGMGEVANFIVQTFDRTYGTFEKLSDVGIVSTFGDLKRSSELMNLSIANTEIIMTKHSKNLALFGATAIDGRKQLEQVAFSTKTAKVDFQKLGISSQDFTEMQASHMNQQMRMSQGQKQTVEQMAAGSLAYMKQLDAMSKLTGMSRKSIQAEREARQSDARYRASMSELPADIQENINAGLDAVVGTFGKATEQGLRDVISTDGAATTDAGKAFQIAMESVGMNVSEVVGKLKNGTMKWPEMFDKLKDAGKLNVEQMRGLAAAMGLDTKATTLFVELSNGSIKAGIDTQKTMGDLSDEQAKNLKDTESTNAQLAKTKQNLEQLQMEMEQMTTNSTLVTKLLDKMSEALKEGILDLSDAAGVSSPLSAAQRRVSNAKKDLALAKEDQVGARLGRPQMALRTARLVTGSANKIAAGEALSGESVVDRNARIAAQKVTDAEKELAIQLQRATEAITPSSRSTPSAPSSSSSSSAPAVGASASAATSAPNATATMSADSTNTTPPSTSSTSTASAGPTANQADGVSVATMEPLTRTDKITPTMYREALAVMTEKFNTLASLLEDNADGDRRQLTRTIG